MSEQLKWFKSSYSDGEGGACVEIAACPTTIHVRDSKLAKSPELTLPAAAWAAFVANVPGRPGA
ncbi:DUF397 domain-containing protein [Streptomyces sp. NBC_01142]|uniref:DUF397 domain-containing protein n=1 Tax=Streptomyces sp. NBC_01142 TaxID=2975865 RepID=UPI0022525AF0|nr:DUF397 domain-containing protein [Streptomyces sp. NBC_01142]MCX4824704.1 DUF397 domain-containing protein [Streptomyces sp. NBC_01142]